MKRRLNKQPFKKMTKGDDKNQDRVKDKTGLDTVHNESERIARQRGRDGPRNDAS